MSTRKSPSGRPLAAVFSTYQDAPVSVVLVRLVAPGVRKYGVMAWVASSTMEGSRHRDAQWMLARQPNGRVCVVGQVRKHWQEQG